ncbi:hypothetical protein AB6A40_001681 [Gnathostoma spinigerum]|uniref:Uncharacterized protein n=1 Tax=Gnathostoma spinigerum TaxID=75299 RepID=A0ABD6EE54_9BILA
MSLRYELAGGDNCWYRLSHSHIPNEVAQHNVWQSTNIFGILSFCLRKYIFALLQLSSIKNRTVIKGKLSRHCRKCSEHEPSSGDRWTRSSP